MDLTRARQRLTLAQGLALGALMSSAAPITGNKTTLELNFRRVWREWPYRDLFPSIKAGPAQDDLFLILGDEVRRGRRGVTWWTAAWPFHAAADGDDWDELAEFIDGKVPAAGWSALVGGWLAGPGAVGRNG